MIGYVTVGTNDMDRACKFYDEVFSTIGVERLWTHGDIAAWGRSRSEPAFCVVRPLNKEKASFGNGSMVALKMSKTQEVELIYARVLELGGKDEGAPGPRGDHGFFGAYFRDLDGNKLNAYVPGS